MGVLAVLAGTDASFLAIMVTQDFRNPAVHVWFAACGESIICAMAFVAFGIGARFLHFGLTGRDHRNDSLVRSVLLSIGMFFPGLVFSLPLTLLCASRIWQNGRCGPDLAIEVSVGIGLASSIACAAWFLKEHRAQSRIR